MAELAGSLRERVVIERWLAGRDENGADVGEWRRLASVAAALVPEGTSGGAPGFEGEAVRSRMRWQVTLRAGPVIDLATRLRWRGRSLAVLAVTTDPARPDRLTLRAEERP